MAMIQYGDITKLKGDELEPVDLIVGGSPCQDLSVAGKRAGLDGERSGLFMEMIRIIKEMREKTNGVYPRFALWENVPGAFSSNKGKDFSAVLGEFARVAEPDAPDVSVPEEGWPKSGVLLGANWSIAWRTHDAQYWGVPQRRRRISLVADFRGQSAPEILFERKSMSGDLETSGEEREDPAETIADSTGETGECLNSWDVQSKHIQPENGIAEALYSGECRYGGGESYVLSFQERSGKPGGGKGILLQKDHTGALSTMNNQMVLDDKDTGETVYCLAGNGIDRAETAGCNGKGWTEDVSFTLNTIDRPAVFDSQVHRGCKEFEDGVSQTVTAQYGTGGNNMPLVVAIGNGQYQTTGEFEKCPTLSTMHDQQCVMTNVIGALCADDYKGPNRQYVEDGKCKITDNTVRRITPLECERLQGYPDGWTDIPGASDSKRYKALGNSIALPFWAALARRFVEIGKVKSIGSLFDGIGGFPLCFKRAGAETKWTSEIEPFPEQVVKYHIDKGDL